MPFLNVEIKAKCSDPGRVRDYLLSHQADFRGRDEQTDTYFNIRTGRLKLREGLIENNLIYYSRADHAGPKNSTFHLVPVAETGSLKELLLAALGVKMIVVKRREIYYIENVKFHIDEVDGLGGFIEIEAGNIKADLSQDKLQEQCEFYMKEFGISPADLVAYSYSDLLMEKSKSI